LLELLITIKSVFIVLEELSKYFYGTLMCQRRSMTTIQDMDRVMSPQKHMVVSQSKKDMMRFVRFSILGSSRH